MKKSTSIFLLVLLLIGSTAQAQFKKPLQSASSKVNSTEARYNIGLIGGITSTYWVHFGGTKTPYKEPINFGIVGGLSIERMLDASNSIGLEGLYAMRNMQLNYDILNFPDALNVNNNYYRQLDVNYQEVDVQAILTHYFSKSNIRPYVFIGPRVSVPLSGKMVWQKTKIEEYGTANQHLNEAYGSVDTVEMTAQNTRPWNVGIVAGAGLMFKLNLNNYYFLVKADVSAHAAFINSFTREEINGQSQNVVGAGYIDPYLLGMRFNTDAMAKITFLFPLKKQLQGACIRWGEYD